MSTSKTPMMAGRPGRRMTLVVVAGLLLAACGRDVVAPNESHLVATDPSRALSGAHDQTYSFDVDPTHDSPHLTFGASYITIPAHAICNLASSQYGPSYWNSSCVPETNTVHITVVVTNAETDNPGVEFHPAMRFNPATSVNLFLKVTNAATLSNMTIMKYCPTGPVSLQNSACIDESINDPSLVTNVDKSNLTVFRRIKHFSGYLIAE